jgi:tetratricopeptide (TPR) repeat protein
VTSRNSLAGLVARDGARALALDVLSEDESAQLFSARVGADRVDAEPDAVKELIRLAAQLPLALAIAAAQAAVQPHLSLAALVAHLLEARGALEAFSGEDPTTSVRVAFGCSYHTLRPAASRMFRLLGLHPGPDISTAAAASLAAEEPDQTRRLLTDLCAAHLINEPTAGRYTLHDLLRSYATELTYGQDGHADRDLAQRRMFDHYLHTAHTAAQLLHVHRDPITLAAAHPAVHPEILTDKVSAMAWFTAEHAVLLAILRQACSTGFDAVTWQLSWSLLTFLDRQGHWQDQVHVQHAAVAAARRLKDPVAQGHAHRQLARAYMQLHQYPDARAELHKALDVYLHSCDLAGQANTHNNFAQTWERERRYPEALHHAERALNLHRRAGNRRGQTTALNAIGWYHALLGNYQEALAHCHEALARQQENGDDDGQAESWDSLGYAHHHLTQYTEAITCYRHAIVLFRNLGDRYNEATTLAHLGDTHHATGQPDAARICWERCLDILNDLEHPDADEVRTKLDNLAQTEPRQQGG